MESVLEVRSGLVVLRRGAERSVVLVSSGILGYALDKAKVGPPALCTFPAPMCCSCACACMALGMHGLEATCGSLPNCAWCGKAQKLMV